MTGDRRTSTLRADLIAGALYALLFAFVALGPGQRFLYGLDASYFDRLAAAQAGAPDPSVAIVAIDEPSVRNIGRFPFSRDVLAQVTDSLASGGATSIVSTLVFSEPQVDAGADYLRDLDRTLAQMAQDNASDGAPLEALKQQVAGAIDAIDYDRQLVSSVQRAGNVLLPVLVDGATRGGGTPLAASNDALGVHTLAPEFVDHGAPVDRATRPLPALMDVAAGVGHLGFVPDRDGVIRALPLVLTHRDDALPALSLVAALRQMGLDREDIALAKEPPRLTAGRLSLPLHRDGRVLTRFYPDGAQPSFRTESFYDVFTGLVPANSFRGQTVLIGATAAGIGDALVTPAGSATAPVELLAHTVSALTQQHIYERPGYARGIVLAVFAALWLYIVFALPRLSAVAGALISLALCAALLFAEAIVLSGYGHWLALATPVLFLGGGYLVMTVRRFGLTERLKLQTEAASAESNRMLGLAFQNQGQLDMAFEKFRRCPLDDSLMQPLYNLALDFERKRQFNKAGAVYARMAEHDPDFRDISARVKRNERLDETLVVGASSPHATRFILDDDEVQKPMLGRYVVERELGKGAMGTVYLGRDPKINRVVAIKTIALSQEFDENEVASVRERFFREAETAGRLNHPDIVTVYDAGEEHDLAYIAMEYLKGTHMSGYTRADALLPDDKVVELMARVADALGYAHREDVVHRDIKPANIMYDPGSGQLKITDFGIARITSSSKTKTGIVLGTPSYMSPEQLAGKNVTGRSDLFSLGVTIYQLLAGQLPFRADSMATLMYKIANEPHTPLHAVRPELPACLGTVIDRALAKAPTERYELGAQMALELRECRASLAA